MDDDIRKMFVKVIGGDEDRFFRESWRKRTLLVKSALAELVGVGEGDRFIRDYDDLNFHDATLLIEVDDSGKRRMSQPNRDKPAVQALASGMSMVLQTSYWMEQKNGPWRWVLTWTWGSG